ncbi:hypothetical protein DC498_04540 [Terrimonas sp.]|uniref:hypothetical protein n=1 Tax=Terrimonas sp. TaxID=1914338 RepID=UPI000D513EE7|nr:hypothetical protein [Terrimonas sp.]PVD53783.1 hypothetical protein DC498_04540 [Terrimonas sp.]
MNIGSKLYAFRIYHNKECPEVAIKLGISLDIYIALESGSKILNQEIAENLSKIYNVPREIFYENNIREGRDFRFINSPFNGSNGYVHNLYQQDIRLVNLILESKNETIKLLKEEIFRLQTENQLLFERLLPK